MRQLLVCLFVVFVCTAFGQKRKTANLHYKTIHDTRFLIGDRISLGEIPLVYDSKEKDSIVIPDSLELYRAFVQRNPQMTLKLHMIWRNQGVKFPGRTNFTRDVLLDYLNEDGPDEDSTCYIYGYKHSFFKQEPLLILELEVIDLQSVNNLNTPVHGTISLPEMNQLYRGYNNIMEFAVNGQYDSLWVKGDGVELTQHGSQYIARISSTKREVSMTLYSRLGENTTEHGVFRYRVSNLPLPMLYWGSLPFDHSQLKSISDSLFLQMGQIFAKYPPEIPLKASFEVGEMTIRIGDSTYTNKGKTVSKEIIDAYINAEEGTAFTIDSVEVRGPIHETIIMPFTRTKSTPKGKTFKFHKGVLYSEGC